MGFYDDDELRRTTRQPRRSSYVLTALISAIIGGLLVLVLAPTLLNNGIIQPSAEQEPQVNNETTIGETATVGVNVTSDIVDAVEKVRNAVVGVVNVTKHVDPWTQHAQSVQQGTGSGVIFEKVGGKARVVTNNHVIAGADTIEVVLSDGTHVPAKLLGADETTDLAVLEINDDKVQSVAEFGDSDKLRVGEPAIAIGNPLGLGFSQSVTSGVISAKDRTIQVNQTTSLNVIQTDAAINPGNSGGPLINIAGQVIGINSLKIAQQGIEGLGFAIPINEAKPIIKDLIENGRVIRPYMGVSLIDLEAVPRQKQQQILRIPDNVKEGVVVYDIRRNSPAYDDGLRQYDVIVQLDNEKVKNSAELQRYLYKQKSVGDTMAITLYREGEKKTIEIILGETPVDLTQ